MNFIHEVLYGFIALISIINPLGSLALFLTASNGASINDRQSAAAKVGLYGFVFLLAVMLFGTPILSFFGIKLRFVEAAGGMVILSSAWKAMTTDDSPKPAVNTPITNSADKLFKSLFVPITFPMTVGPGSCAVLLGLTARIPRTNTITELIGYCELAIASALAMICVWLVYRYSNKITATLGANGTRIATKLLMFLLVCMGLEMIYDGLVLMN